MEQGCLEGSAGVRDRGLWGPSSPLLLALGCQSLETVLPYESKRSCLRHSRAWLLFPALLPVLLLQPLRLLTASEHAPPNPASGPLLMLFFYLEYLFL